MLGSILFRKAQNKIQNPAKLRQMIVGLVDKGQGASLFADGWGVAYEGLLQKERRGRDAEMLRRGDG